MQRYNFLFLLLFTYYFCINPMEECCDKSIAISTSILDDDPLLRKAFLGAYESDWYEIKKMQDNLLDDKKEKNKSNTTKILKRKRDPKKNHNEQNCNSNRYNLRIHKNVCAGKNSFKCRYCSKKISTQSRLSRHISICHQN